MNYEDHYQNVLVLEKTLKEKLQNTQKSFKKVTADSEFGRIRNLSKNITQLSDQLNEIQDLTVQLKELAGSFDAKTYFESGDFAKQLIDYCDQYSVDMRGEFPTYELFPYNVKIDVENQDLYVNKRKNHCVRPLKFVLDIKKKREKYLKSAFNMNMFLNELAAAYDLAIVVKSKSMKDTIGEYHVHLRDLYNYLAPTGRARNAYDLRSYAFDLARVYTSPVREIKDQRKFEFSPSKTTKKLIRILDQFGSEQYLGTIRFYSTEY